MPLRKSNNKEFEERQIIQARQAISVFIIQGGADYEIEYPQNLREFAATIMGRNLDAPSFLLKNLPGKENATARSKVLQLVNTAAGPLSVHGVSAMGTDADKNLSLRGASRAKSKRRWL